jgi:hypothetical protein
MKILTVCDQGNNRSVQFAHLLKYWNHDVLPIGLKTNSTQTIYMLCNWAEKIILTESLQIDEVPQEFRDKTVVFNVGPDNYPRPFNPELNRKARQFLEDNKSWLKK